ncbi:MAG: hypothetical protein VB099_01840 [Candidatus Limiplasma sp.]|nr:hypothetical protein [Candidatus Limiplasma sp.]
MEKEAQRIAEESQAREEETRRMEKKPLFRLEKRDPKMAGNKLLH